jgi:hypothetical protein
MMSTACTVTISSGSCFDCLRRDIKNSRHDSAQLPGNPQSAAAILARACSASSTSGSDNTSPSSGTYTRRVEVDSLGFEVLVASSEAQRSHFFDRYSSVCSRVYSSSVMEAASMLTAASTSYHLPVLCHGLNLFIGTVGQAYNNREFILIFPCCGQAVYETSMARELLRRVYNVKHVVYMDRGAVSDDTDAIRCSNSTFLHSSQSLVCYVRALRTAAVVVGFNALTTHPTMYMDPYYSPLLEACKVSEHVFDHFLLVRSIPKTLAGLPSTTTHSLRWGDIYELNRPYVPYHQGLTPAEPPRCGGLVAS